MKRSKVTVVVFLLLIISARHSSVSAYEVHQLGSGEFPSPYNGSIAYNGTLYGLGTEIYYWDGNCTTRITQDNKLDLQPSLYDGAIAWQDNTSPYEAVYYWDGTNTTQLTSYDDAPARYPSVYNGGVAWAQNDNIYYWDGLTTVQVSGDESHAVFPSLHENMVAWFDLNDQLVYYAETDMNPVSIPSAGWLFGAGLLGLFGVKRKFKK